MSEPKPLGKPCVIDRNVVMEAWRRVAANRGAPGVDEVSVSEFAQDLKGDLYKIWNRLSSGTYLPPPVRVTRDPQAAWAGDAGPGCAHSG